MLPSGDYLPRIALADAMVINLCVKKSCGVKSLFEAAKSCVERSNTMIKAKEHSKLSSYQTLKMDKNR
jgi:hypothetical protein